MNDRSRLSNKIRQMCRAIHWVLGTSLIVVLIACAEEVVTERGPSMQLPSTKNGEYFQVYVETALGSHHLLNYRVGDEILDTLFETDIILPLPVNAGFIPLRSQDSLIKIRSWIIGKRMEPGDTLTVRIIGLIKYQLDELQHQDLVVVPVEDHLATVAVQRFRDFIIGYDPVKFSFEYWLRNHRGRGSLTQLAWEDEEQASAYLNNLLQD